MTYIALIICSCMIATTLAQVATRDNYKFGFDTGSHYRREHKGDDGMVRGEYGFRTPDGCLHVTRYEARENGAYKVLGSSKRDCGTKRPRLPTRIPTTQRPTTTTTSTTPSTTPSTTTTTPSTTTTKPSTTTTTPFTTTRKSFTTTKIPSTTTTQQTTTTRRRTTTARSTTTTTTTAAPTTSTTNKPDTTPPKVIEQISNFIEDTPEPAAVRRSGKQLRQPNLTTRRPAPSTTTRPTTVKPTKKAEPVYSFGYEAPGHGHSQSGLPDGSKKGEYFFDSPDGWRRIVTYVATKKGFFPKMRRVRIPTTTPKPPPGGEAENKGKNLEEGEIGAVVEEEIELPVNGCPYYFYYNTRIHYHWERCHDDGNKTGEYGRLADDGYQYKTWYYADGTGYHPTVSKTEMTPEQRNLMAEYSERTFIIPKPEEERRETEKRIQDWVQENRDKIDQPLR